MTCVVTNKLDAVARRQACLEADAEFVERKTRELVQEWIESQKELMATVLADVDGDDLREFLARAITAKVKEYGDEAPAITQQIGIMRDLYIRLKDSAVKVVLDRIRRGSYEDDSFYGSDDC